MICTRCGTKNSKTSKYCRECGKRLVVEALELEVEEKAEQAGPPNDEAVTELLYETLKLYQSGKLEAAFSKCREAIRMNPNSPSGRSLLTLIYEKKADEQADKGNWEDAQDYLNAAIRQIERVLEANPESVADREKLAELRAKLEALTEKGTAPLQPLPARLLAMAARVPLRWAAGLGVFVLVFVLLMAFLGRKGEPAKAEPTQARSVQPSPQPNQGLPPPVSSPSSGLRIPAWTYRPPDSPTVQPNPSGQERPYYQPPEVTEAPEALVPLEPYPVKKQEPPPSPDRKPEQAKEPPPAPERAPAETARAAYARGDYQTAASAYEDAIKQGEDSPENHQALGMCLYNLGRKDAAIVSFNRAVQLYLDRKAKGIDVEAAEQGIRTCKQYIELSKE